MRVNVNLNEDLLSKIDENAKVLNISRSAFISVCCSSDMNVDYKLFNTEKLIDKHIEKIEEQEHYAKFIGNMLDIESD